VLQGMKKHRKIVVALHIQKTHFITLEVDYDEKRDGDLVTIHVADGLDSDGDNAGKTASNYDKPFRYLLYKVLFDKAITLTAIRDGVSTDKHFKYVRIADREKQDDSVNCGIFVLRRMFLRSRKGLQIANLPDVRTFRLLVLQDLLEHKTILPNFLKKPVIKEDAEQQVSKSDALKMPSESKSTELQPVTLLSASAEYTP
jgi:hypothetical protein